MRQIAKTSWNVLSTTQKYVVNMGKFHAFLHDFA